MLQDHAGDTALMLAAANGHTSIVKHFLKALAKIDKANKIRWQNMCRASLTSATTADIVTIQHNHQRYVDHHTNPNGNRSSFNTSSSGACRNQHPPTGMTLVKPLIIDSVLKFALDFKNRTGQTALDLAKLHKK